ncbi:Uncharacterised protein [Vibrio cholerae]|nr:Uncharacterised protein [Vibrio cholerae]
MPIAKPKPMIIELTIMVCAVTLPAKPRLLFHASR